jgi:hypothetical protein
MAILVALGIAVVIYFTTAQDTKEILRAINSQKTATTTSAGRLLESELDLFNRELAMIGNQKKLTLVQMISEVTSQKTSGIAIESFDYSQELDEPTLRLQGRASSRNQLLAFIEALKKDSRVARVDSPVSNLIKDRGAEFTITLTYHGQ